MNSLKSNSNQTLRSRQRLTPLLLLAFSLVGLGGYTSYQSLVTGRRVVDIELIKVPPPMQISVLDAIPESLLVDEFPDGISLYYQPGGAQNFEMWMHQQNEYEEVGTGKRTIETAFNLTWRDLVETTDAPERLEVIRDFGKVRIEVSEQGELVGSDITHQLAILLSNTQAHITMSDRGVAKSRQWVSEMNAQTAQTLHLIDDAFRLVHPHFLREAVHIGEDWTYWLRTTAEDTNLDRLEADGSLEVTNRVEGMLTRNSREYAVIVQKIVGSMRGLVDGTSGYTAHGNGRGLVLFDVEAGVIYSSQIEFERTLKQDEEQPPTGLDTTPMQRSKIRLYLVQRVDDQAAIK